MKCFDCNGEGGEYQFKLEDGSGPFEYCGLCQGSGELPFYKWLYLRFLWWKYNAKTYYQRKANKKYV